MRGPARVVAVAVVLAACRGGGSEGTGGTFRVNSAFTRAQYDAAPRLTLTPGYTLCDGGQLTACQFRRIDVAALGPGRRVLLGQAGGVVQEFDSTGRWTGALGRLGAGPGEYRMVMSAGFDPDGGVTLFDQAGFRIVRFDSVGRAIGTRSVLPSADFTGVSAKGGRVIAWLVPGAARVGDTVTGSFVLLDSAGPGPVLARVATKALRAPGTDLMPIPPFFSARAVWDVGPGLSIVYAPGDRLRIERYAQGGTADLLIEGDAPLRAVTPSDVARELERRSPRGPVQGPWPAQLQQAARSAARFHPAITDVAVLGDGSIWAKGSPDADGNTARHDVFSADGRLTGYVVLPAAARVIGGDGAFVLVTTVDSSGSPIAVVYRR